MGTCPHSSGRPSPPASSFMPPTYFGLRRYVKWGHDTATVRWHPPEDGAAQLTVAHFKTRGPVYDDALSRLGDTQGALLLMLPTDLAAALRQELDGCEGLRVGARGSRGRHPPGPPPPGRHKRVPIGYAGTPPHRAPRVHGNPPPGALRRRGTASPLPSTTTGFSPTTRGGRSSERRSAGTTGAASSPACWRSGTPTDRGGTTSGYAIWTLGRRPPTSHTPADSAGNATQCPPQRRQAPTGARGAPRWPRAPGRNLPRARAGARRGRPCTGASRGHTPPLTNARAPRALPFCGSTCSCWSPHQLHTAEAALYGHWMEWRESKRSGRPLSMGDTLQLTGAGSAMSLRSSAPALLHDLRTHYPGDTAPYLNQARATYPGGVCEPDAALDLLHPLDEDLEVGEITVFVEGADEAPARPRPTNPVYDGARPTHPYAIVCEAFPRDPTWCPALPPATHAPRGWANPDLSSPLSRTRSAHHRGYVLWQERPGTPLLLLVDATRGDPERVLGITLTHLNGAAPVPRPPLQAPAARDGVHTFLLTQEVTAVTGVHLVWLPPAPPDDPRGPSALSPALDLELWRDAWAAWLPRLPSQCRWMAAGPRPYEAEATASPPPPPPPPRRALHSTADGTTLMHREVVGWVHLPPRMPTRIPVMSDSDGSPQRVDRHHRQSRSRSPVFLEGAGGKPPAEREEGWLAEGAVPVGPPAGQP